MRPDRVKRGPPDRAGRQAIVDRAVRAFQQGDHQQACLLFQQAARGAPATDPSFEFNFGFIHRNAGQIDRALDAFSRAIRLKPNFADAVLQKGLCYRDLGRTDQAMAAYREALTIDAAHVGARLNLANGLYAAGELDEAEVAYRQLLARNPNDPNVILGLGNVCFARRQWVEAMTWYEQVLRTGAKTLDALCNLGASLAKLGRHAEAVDRYRGALADTPEHLVALSGVAESLAQLGRHSEAIELLVQALDRGIDQVEIWRRCAVLLDGTGEAEAALTLIDKALMKHRDEPDLLALRAVCLNSLERFEETIKLCDRLVADPRTASLVAWNACGTALDRTGRIQESVECFKRALEIDPQHPDLLNNLGNAYREQQRWEDAIELISKAIELRPDYADAYYNRAVALGDLLQIDDSLADYARCIDLAPDNADAHFNRALAMLLDGRYDSGWIEYEWRWKTRFLRAMKHPDWIPLWDGVSSLENRSILIYAEQGLGDTLQFVRFARDLAERGARVLVQAQASIAPLLAQFEPRVSILGESAEPEADYRCPMMSLPRVLGVRLDTLGGRPSYLAAPIERVALWREKLGITKGLRVGLVWSGNASHTNDRHRSIPAEMLMKALPVGPEYFCLQRDIRDSDRGALSLRSDVVLLEEQLTDFADTAAICELLDLVISVDTSVAHLAGALGRPLWVLLPRVPDMRWLLAREDSPWYPSARLFRQEGWGEWSNVLNEVASQLTGLAASNVRKIGSTHPAVIDRVQVGA